ncbi:MAG: GIY-YIG nuclease family protein [Pseudomonadota bacterium]
MRFYATKENRTAVTDGGFCPYAFKLNFLNTKPEYFSEISEERGVYFVSGEREGNPLKVYVGKANNFRKRLRDYHRGFQVHSPNDRKLAFVQEWLGRADPQWQLRLHTLEVEQGKDLDKVERKWIRLLDRLVNGTVRLGDQEKEKIHAAYRNYFHEFFANKLRT